MPPSRIVWTDERRALLTRDYPTMRPTEEIYAELQAMPGVRLVGLECISVQAKKLGLKRPEGFRRHNFHRGRRATPAQQPRLAIVPIEQLPPPRRQIAAIASQDRPPRPPRKWGGVGKPSEEQAFSMLGGRVR